MSEDTTKLDELRGRLARIWEEAGDCGLQERLRQELTGLLASTPAETTPAETSDGSDPSGEGTSIEVPCRWGIVGASAALHTALDLVERVARSDVPVLILGETGTGKELFAKALHAASARSKKPFFAENCAAVPAELLESEFFGHKKGSFTGAVSDRPGHFVSADGGTVFLDEIGDMPLPMQAKLLRVLQDGEVRPVGSNKSVHVDVRVLAATHKDLTTMCSEGSFREDLYFRLNVITIPLPPLRDREGDVEHLVNHFLAKAALPGESPATVDEEALTVLSDWHWPGNVRELENEVQRAVALSDGRIRTEELSPRIREGV